MNANNGMRIIMFSIETARCIINEWRDLPEERAAFRRWTTDVEMMRHVTGTAWSDADRERFFARQRASMEKAGVCFGPARLKESGEVIGVVGAQPLELVDDWHLGWWIDPRWQGQGLATELARAALDHVLDVAKRPRAVAVIAPENHASRRVAEKIGMRHVATVPGNTLESRWKAEDVVLYGS